MKTDAEILLMLRERGKGRTQEQTPAKAGMSVRTARTYSAATAGSAQVSAIAPMAPASQTAAASS